jgi:hypothetical protein
MKKLILIVLSLLLPVIAFATDPASFKKGYQSAQHDIALVFSVNGGGDHSVASYLIPKIARINHDAYCPSADLDSFIAGFTQAYEDYGQVFPMDDPALRPRRDPPAATGPNVMPPGHPRDVNTFPSRSTGAATPNPNHIDTSKGVTRHALVAQTPTLPAPPARYFNDFAAIVRPETTERLNQQLESFERQTSNQIVVAIYPNLPEGVALDDYAQQVFHSWKVGQRGRDNGVIFFVFVQDRKMRIQTGRGLEDALPNTACKRILDEEIAPHFKAGEFDEGLTAGVNAIIAATKVAYKGTGKTVAETLGLEHQN